MKDLIEALQFCKENNIFDTNINIALGLNLYVQTFEEAAIQNKIKLNENNISRG
jgi:hypothetical protein